MWLDTSTSWLSRENFYTRRYPHYHRSTPEGVEPKKIKLTLPREGMEWFWLCVSHGPKEICPRREEIDTEFGHQRLKELLQQIVKAEGKLGKGAEMIDKIPGV